MQVLQLIKEYVQQNPDRLVWIHREERMTYRDLWERSDALASWIREQSGKSPIIVYGHKEPEMILCFLASVKVGRCYVPIDSSTPWERVEQIMSNANSSLILAVGDGELPPIKGKKIINHEEIQRLIHEREGFRIDSSWWIGKEQPFYMIYTSGSTGTPKGVQITSSNLFSFLIWMRENFGLLENQIFIGQAPLSFDLSVMDTYTALATGGTVWAIDRAMIERPRELFSGLQSSKGEIWVSTPSFVEFCLMEPTFSSDHLPELNTFLFCGEPLSPSCAGKLHKRFPKARIFNTYGPTEATVAVTSIEIEASLLEDIVLPVGTCKPDCKVLIVDEEGRSVPDSEKGEIIIAGPSVSIGYYQNPILTDKAFFMHEGLRAYRTGDIGFMKKGILYCSGRKDFQIKLQGYRIELEDIEENLKNLPMVQSAAVVPVYRKGKCDGLIAYIALEGRYEWAKSEPVAKIKDELSKRLPSYMIPRKMVVIDKLPLTRNGKIDRQALRGQ